MDKSAIEKIIEVAEPHIIEENGYKYADKPLNVIAEPQVKTLSLYTLSSLAELLIKEYRPINTPVIVQVDSPTKVSVYSGINATDRSRENPYTVYAETPEFSYGRWYSYEEMMIALKSKFVETPELLEVVKLLGTITEENNTNIADDGFTQTVTVRKGVVLKDSKAVNPRVKLMPYCTFSEVKQPERDFLLRLDGNGGVSLHEADGGEWKLRARHSIADRLREMLSELTDVVVVE